MNPKSVSYAEAAPRLSRHDRAQARLARIAVNDTVYGGARALTLANRACELGVKFDAQQVVSEVYCASNYKAGNQFGTFECGECGQVYLGIEDAAHCCTEEEEE